MGLRPHDLLRLRSPCAVAAGDAPDWARRSLEAASWAVVRRAASANGLIPVGIRGESRAERHAALVAPDAVLERCAPEDLAGREPPRAHPVFAALATIRERLAGAGLVWGPAGGAGFELATNRPVLTAASDLDLIVRLDPGDEDALRAFAEAATARDVRVDVLVESPAGGFALGEFLSPVAEILLRTPDGPKLVPKASLSPDPVA